MTCSKSQGRKEWVSLRDERRTLWLDHRVKRKRVVAEAGQIGME